MTLACGAARKLRVRQLRSCSDLPGSVPGGCASRPASTRLARFLPALAVLAALALAGCGKGSQTVGQRGRRAAAERRPDRRGGRRHGHHAQHDAGGRRRRGRRRGGGGARRLPGPDPGHSRPQAVVIVDRNDWTAALAASRPRRRAAERSDPLRGRRLAAAGQPRSARSDAPARLRRARRRAGDPRRHRSRAARRLQAEHSLPADGPGARPRSSSCSPRRPARPRARRSCSASKGHAPCRWPRRASRPRARRRCCPSAADRCRRASEALLRSMHHPAIYVMNAAHLSRSALGALARLGRVTQHPRERRRRSDRPRTRASIAAARFTDGSFGWGVKEPGHGLVFARSSRAAGRARSGAALGDRRLRPAAAARIGRRRSPRSSPPTSATSSPRTAPRPNSRRCAVSTITAG